MNRALTRIQNIILHQILIIFLVGFTFFGLQAFNYGNTIFLAEEQIQETVITPEGIYYKGTPDYSDIRNDDQVKNYQDRLKDTTENIREKLNLDESLPEATKDFLDSAQNKVQKTVEPITGGKPGYFQEKAFERNK